MADALEAHQTSLTKGGGRRGVRDENTVLSALGRPYHGYHRRISQKCAALLHGIATSHGFTDGNKRTALLLTAAMIERSGYYLHIAEGERVDDVVVAVVEGAMREADLERWFRERLQKL